MALALGFARPVIVPDLTPLLEVVQPGREALMYRAGDHRDLVRAMLEACGQDPQTQAGLRLRAQRTADAVTFAHLAAACGARLAAIGDAVPAWSAS